VAAVRGAGLGLAQLLHAGVDGAAPVGKDGVKQLMLLPVVVGHQGQGHLRFQGNLADGDRMVAVLGKQLFGCQQNGRTPVGAVVGRRAGAVFGGRGRHCHGADWTIV